MVAFFGELKLSQHVEALRHHDVNGRVIVSRAIVSRVIPMALLTMALLTMALLTMARLTVAGAMLLECEGDDAALAELGITSRL